MLQGLLLLPGQHGEGPPGVALDPNPAALLREGTGQKLRAFDIFPSFFTGKKTKIKNKKSCQLWHTSRKELFEAKATFATAVNFSDLAVNQ